jgi:pimeloyl-ACP methyl ester carboxylesterase
MPRVRTNGIDIEYETFGNPAHEPLLLIMGLGAQMILWEEGFCGLLAESGLYVIRFDNRDVGLSTSLRDAGIPSLPALLEGLARGEPPDVPYRLSDMARDSVGLLEALGLSSAHVIGASMGGMIAQTLAVEWPDHVRTLTSMASTTGHPVLPPPKADALELLLLTPVPTDREGYIEWSVEGARMLAGKFPPDEARLRARAARAYDRGIHPDGLARQLAAVLVSGSRREALASVRVPALVIHGDADPLVPLEAGLDTAEAIPGAELLVIEGMGHELPPEVWPRVADAIARHARKALGVGGAGAAEGVGD